MRNSIKAIIIKLKKVQIDIEKYAENYEMIENYERSQELENEIENIETAIQSLEEIE